MRRSGDLPISDAKPLLLKGSGQNPFLDEMPWQRRGLHAFSDSKRQNARVSVRVFKFEIGVFPVF